MADIWIDVDVAQTELPVNRLPLVDATDGDTIDEGVVFNEAGIDLNWNFITSAGSFTQTNVVPTSAGVHDWAHQGNGMYTLEVPASAGTINNDTEGYGWFSGTCTATLPWTSPIYGFRAAAINDALTDGGDLLDVNTTQVSGTAQTAGDLQALITTVDTAVDNISTAVITNAVGADVSADIATAQADLDIITGTAGALIDDGTGAGQIALTAGAIDTVTTATNLTTNNDKSGYRLSATGVDDFWDEATSGHVTAGSFGAANYIIRSATAQGGTTTTVQLDASASGTDDEYNSQQIFIVSGTGAGQGSIISDYTGSSTTASIADTWNTAPSTDSVFVILPFGAIPGASAPSASTVAAAVWDRDITLHTTESTAGSMMQPFHVGTAQTANTSSVTLDATGSSATDDFYNYAVIEIVGATGAGQSRQITAYNGTTKVATVDPGWTTSPTDGNYIIRGLGIDAATVTTIADAVWDEDRSGHVGAGTFGEYVLADAVRISGDATAADGLESAVDGTVPLPSNTTQWLGSAVAGVTQAGVPEVDVTFVGGVAEDLPTATNMQTIDDNVDAVLVDTGTTLPAQIGTPVGADISADIAANLTAVQALNDLSVADILTTAMTESYAAEGVAPTLAQALFWLYQRSADSVRADTTLTVRNLAGTAAGTITLDDGANPTDINRAT